MSHPWLGPAITVGLFVLLTVGVWSWRALWRRPRSPYDRLVYLFGVKYMGGSTWILMSMLMAQREIGLSFSEGQRFLLALVILFPLSPWIGLLWGRSIADFLGASRRPRD